MLDYADYDQVRQDILDRTLDAVRTLPPLVNARYTLSVVEPRYEKKVFTKADEKNALLKNGTLAHRLMGSWVVKDTLTGKEFARTNPMTLMHVPHLTSLGTFVHGGVELAVAKQFRLRSGVYVRKTEDGQTEAHINAAPRGGSSFRIFMDPDNAVFYLKHGGNKVPLFPVLRALGYDQDKLKTAWGDDIYRANEQQVNKPHAINWLQRFQTASPPEPAVVERADPETGAEKEAFDFDATDVRNNLIDHFSRVKLDPSVTKQTLGTGYESVTPDTLVDSTKRILRVARNEDDPDDRDSLEYQTVHDTGDYLAERIKNDQNRVLRALLWRITAKGGRVETVQPSVLDKHVDHLFFNTGLAQSLEEINPHDPYDQNQRVVRLGEGAIESAELVPKEARSVSPSYFGFVDPVRSPASLHVGVDLRLARGVRKGPDNLLYRELIDAKTGKKVLVDQRQAARSTIASPEALSGKDRFVPAIIRSREEGFVDRKDVDYILPSGDDMFSTGANLVPFKNSDKGMRLLMGANYANQALPLLFREAPFVQSKGVKGSIEQEHGRRMGAVMAKGDGVVKGVYGDHIKVAYSDGSTESHELMQNRPFSRKTFLRNIPQVKAGEAVRAGTVLASSNFTNDKGDLALGTNLRVAYLPYHGSVFEDAVVISESASKKLVSEHMLQESIDREADLKIERENYRRLFPGKFNQQQLATISDNGMVKEGTVLHYGDPIFLAVRSVPPSPRTMGRSQQRNAAVTWQHPFPAEVTAAVTDTAENRNSLHAYIRADLPMQVGDKMSNRHGGKGVVACYDKLTEIYTRIGWVKFAKLQDSDEVLAWPSGKEKAEFKRPRVVIRSSYEGELLGYQDKVLDWLVTPNHRMFCRIQHYRGVEALYKFREASAAYGKYTLYHRAAVAVDLPTTVGVFEVPALSEKARGKQSRRVFDRVDFAEFMGWWLAEGSLAFYRGEHIGKQNSTVTQYRIQIAQHESVNAKKCRQIEELLARMGLPWTKGKSQQYSIANKTLYHWLCQFGKACDKYVPEELFGWGREALEALWRGLSAGDGSAYPNIDETLRVEYTTTSARLAADVDRLAALLGKNARIRGARPAAPGQLERHVVSVGGHVEHSSRPQGWYRQNYRGMVYCVDIGGGAVYVRRKGRPFWCGNSVVPDAEMLRDESGRTIDVVLSPTSVLSRTNSAQMLEAQLGKIAERTGKPYVVGGFEDKDLPEWVAAELKRHQLKDTETVHDPRIRRDIPDVFTGNTYFYKLQHTAESKAKARSTGAYTADELPAKGGSSGAKHIGDMELHALLAHGSMQLIKDLKMIKGQRNDNFWRQLKLGETPIMPTVPLVYEKFKGLLAGAGIELREAKDGEHLFAMSNERVKELTGGRRLQTSESYTEKDMQPIPGGLFDPEATGAGGRGDRWSYIQLPEPMLNPIMEEPIRTVLGLRRQDLQDLLAGRTSYDGKSGAEGLRTLLSRLDLGTLKKQALDTVRSGARSKRDAAVRQYQYLSAFQSEGKRPEDFIWERVPVLPPKYRPIHKVGRLNVVSDPNYLYKAVLDSITDFNDTQKEKLPPNEVKAARANVYSSLRALVGVADPVQPELVEKGVGGILEQITGRGSPKGSFVQRRLIGANIDVSGMGVITPDPNLRLNQVGLPESLAWNLYEPFIVRDLVRHGWQATDAAKAVAQKAPGALNALQRVVKERPVIYNRAPTLHKYSILGAWPVLTKGDTFRIHPAVVKPFGADFDGDVMSFSVPVSKAAVDEVVSKMMPEKLLLGERQDQPNFVPGNEYLLGLYLASKAPAQKTVRRFPSRQAAVQAYRDGKLRIDDPIEIG